VTAPSFSALGVSEPVVQALAARGIMAPFQIQELVLPEALQVRGDCRAKVCGSEGSQLLVSDMDDASDGNECTLDACAESGAIHSLVAAGTACSKGKCASDGVCHAPGETVWNAQIPLPGVSMEVDCLAADSSGAIIVTGRYHTPSFPYIKAFAVKVNDHGGKEWQADFGQHVDGMVLPLVTADDVVVTQFSSSFDTAQGDAANVVALSAGGSQLWSHATPAGSFVSPSGLALATDGAILAGYTFQNDSCADFGGGSVCADGVVSYDAAGNYVDFAPGAAMTMACSKSLPNAVGERIMAHADGMNLVVEKQLQ